MTFAMVKVFPLPVTPRSVWCRLPAERERVRFAIARPWSPRGSYLESNSNGTAFQYPAAAPAVQQPLRKTPKKA